MCSTYCTLSASYWTAHPRRQGRTAQVAWHACRASSGAKIFDPVGCHAGILGVSRVLVPLPARRRLSASSILILGSTAFQPKPVEEVTLHAG
jgi:hypothetical protein